MAQFQNEAAQMLNLMQAFQAFDSDNDHHITAAQLGSLMGSMGHNMGQQEAESTMGRADKNRDGLLSLREFLELNVDRMDVDMAAMLPQLVFNAVDAVSSNVGDVTGEEVFGMLKDEMNVEGVSVEECEEIVKCMDLHSFEELTQLLDSLSLGY